MTLKISNSYVCPDCDIITNLSTHCPFCTSSALMRMAEHIQSVQAPPVPTAWGPTASQQAIMDIPDPILFLGGSYAD